MAGRPVGEYPVEWFPGFNLGLRLHEPARLESSAEVARAISTPWYGPYTVYSTVPGNEGQVMSLASCVDYLAVDDLEVQPVKPSESSPFMGMSMMCQAASLIVAAEPANRSFVRELVFDRDLPTLLPPELTIAISSSEVERVGAAKADESWDDIAGIARYEPCDARDGEHCGIYYDDTAGRQQVQLVARGDFNADGIEDALVSSGDSLKGGSYSALRMFVLTRRSPDGSYELLEQLDY